MRSPGLNEPIADEGFYQTIQPQLARRQFNVSVGLLALLTLVALIVGVTAGFAPISADPTSMRQARLIVQQPQRVHVMQAEAYGSPRG